MLQGPRASSDQVRDARRCDVESNFNRLQHPPLRRIWLTRSRVRSSDAEDLSVTLGTALTGVALLDAVLDPRACSAVIPSRQSGDHGGCESLEGDRMARPPGRCAGSERIARAQGLIRRCGGNSARDRRGGELIGALGISLETSSPDVPSRAGPPRPRRPRRGHEGHDNVVLGAPVDPSLVLRRRARGAGRPDRRRRGAPGQPGSTHRGPSQRRVRRRPRPKPSPGVVEPARVTSPTTKGTHYQVITTATRALTPRPRTPSGLGRRAATATGSWTRSPRWTSGSAAGNSWPSSGRRAPASRRCSSSSGALDRPTSARSSSGPRPRRLGDEALAALRRADRVVFQQFHLIPTLNARENVGRDRADGGPRRRAVRAGRDC